MTVGFIVDVEFVWGFQARIIGLSKTSPSFYYPPPTTFLGALAEVIAKKSNIGENLGRFIIDELSKNLLAIGFRPINCIPIKYEDLNKIISIKKTSGVLYPNPNNLSKSFDSPARGKTILSSLNDKAPIIRWFLIFKDRTIYVQDENLNNKVEMIELSEEIFWKIHRLGSKESRVSVVEVKSYNNEEIKRQNKNNVVITNYSFPVESMRSDSEEKIRKWEYEIYVNPYGNSIYKENGGIFDKYILLNRFKEKKKEKSKDSQEKLLVSVFKIPIICSHESPEYIVYLKNNWIGYYIHDKDKKEMVIGRNEWGILS